METEFYHFWADIESIIKNEMNKLEKVCHSCLYEVLNNLEEKTEGLPEWKVRYIYEEATKRNLIEIKEEFNNTLHKILKNKPQYFKNYIIHGQFKELFYY